MPIELSNKVTAILTTTVTVFMVLFNVLQGSLTTLVFPGAKDNPTISNSNPTYVTPDGLTFAIWGIVYLSELAFSIYQVLPQNVDKKEYVAARPWIILAFLLNCIWIVIFAYEFYWLSAGIIFGYWLALVQVYRNLNVNWFNSEDSWLYKFATYTGFSANIAWVTVATAVNLTVALRQSGFRTPASVEIGANADWAILWIVVVAGISAVLSFNTHDLVHNATTAWALSGIVRMQTTPKAERFPIDMLSQTVVNFAVFGEFLILFAAIVSVALFVLAPKFSRPATYSSYKQADDAVVIKA